MQYVYLDLSTVPEHDYTKHKVTVQFKRFLNPVRYWDQTKGAWTEAGGPPFEMQHNMIDGKPTNYYDAMVNVSVVQETVVAIFTHSEFGIWGMLNTKMNLIVAPRSAAFAF